MSSIVGERASEGDAMFLGEPALSATRGVKTDKSLGVDAEGPNGEVWFTSPLIEELNDLYGWFQCMNLKFSQRLA